jgi:beta-fructofuranosidase
MSLPRHLTLLSKDELGQEPAGDVASLHYNAQHIGATKLPANQEIVIKDISGNAMEIAAEIDPKNAQAIEMDVLRSPNKEEYTRIIVFKDKGYTKGLTYSSGPETSLMPEDLVSLVMGEKRKPRTPNPPSSLITIESSYSSTLPDARFRPPETGAFNLDSGETVKLRVFVDRSIVEVFVNGKQCVAMRVYPGRNDSKGVSIRAQGQDAELKSLDAWQMKSIYE